MLAVIGTNIIIGITILAVLVGFILLVLMLIIAIEDKEWITSFVLGALVILMIGILLLEIGKLIGG